MDTNDKFIQERFGRKKPFKVPDGYFDSFPSELMRKISEQERASTARLVTMKPSRKHRFRPVAAIAASVCVAIFGVGLYFQSNGSHPAKEPVSAMQGYNTISYSTVDAMADYAMMDTEDMYAFLTDADL